MFDDDDDPEPQFNVVDSYQFEDNMDGPVCFSILPLKFDENDELAYLDSKVDLHGFADNGLLKVQKKVVAWRVLFDYEYEQPKISVLSNEGNWIELLKPRKCYEKTVRSILTAVQMLHYVGKWPTKGKRSLLDHLCEVFNKFDNKPVERDLMKHHSLIKLFTEMNPTLMKSKEFHAAVAVDLVCKGVERDNWIRHIGCSGTDMRLLARRANMSFEGGSGLACLNPFFKFLLRVPPGRSESSDDEEDFANDNDDDYNDKDENSDDDYSCNNDDDDNGDGKDDNSEDDYSSNDDNKDDDDIDNNDDVGTDPLCAICDNGGKLLSCVGRCKRSFHPRKKDGRESNCNTLGFTSAKLKEIDQYLCKNCEYKQHQCFKCGKLEPSNGTNAKVFQCYKESCGHFYHPSCVAKLLEPHDTDGACELENMITSGMPFTCPVHWCSKCGKMEDSTQLALWLAVCRRCPISYHKSCLPSKISFKEKHGQIIRAWRLGDRIIIYCGHHKIVGTIGTPRRDHIKLPFITEIDRTRDLAKKKAHVAGKRKKNADQGSTESAELSKKLCREEGDLSQRVATNNSMEHIVLKERGAGKKDTIHANQTPNDEVDSLIVEKKAEGDGNFKSGKGRDTHGGENVCRRDLIPGQEKKICRRENRMGGNTYDHGSRSGKEMILRNKINKVGLDNGGFTPDYVNCLPPKKRRQFACVEKAATTNIIDTQQECGCDGGQEVKESHDKATEIDTFNQSRTRGEPKEHATDCKMSHLDRPRKNVNVKNGRDFCCEDGSPRGLDNHKEPEFLAYNFRNNDPNSPWFSLSKSSSRRNDDQRATETSEYKSREGKGVNNGKKWRNCRDNSHMGTRNPQKRRRDYSPEGRRVDYPSSYPRSNNHHRYEQWRVAYYSGDRDGDADRRRYRDDYSSDGDVGRQSSPQQSAFSPKFGTTRGPPSFRTRAEHSTSERRGSLSYLRRSEHLTSQRHVPCLYPQGREHEDYALSLRAVPVPRGPPDVEYDELTNLEYGGYHAIDIPPVGRYSLQGNYSGAYGPQTDASTDQHAAVYRARSYGVRSDYQQKDRSHQEGRAPAAESVMERYAPYLERTNYYPGQGGLPVRGHQNYMDKPL